MPRRGYWGGLVAGGMRLKPLAGQTLGFGYLFASHPPFDYEVVGLTLQLVLELQPAVIILRNGSTYRLIGDGFDEPLICRTLN